MPFDETPDEGGGGGSGGPCDPEKIARLTQLMTVGFLRNIRSNDLCPICAHLDLIEALMDDFADNMRNMGEDGEYYVAASGRRRLCEIMFRVNKEMLKDHRIDKDAYEGRDHD